jgi:hypothetical protein
MLIAVRYLLDRLRHPRSRAQELLQLRRRLLVARRASVSADERELAENMRGLRSRIAIAIGQPTSCATCARRYPPPNGRWDGGYCCGTDTWRVFTDEELVAIAASGTRAADLVCPQSDHAGCVFRGPTGCTISAVDRPNICLRYLCLTLVGELRERGDLKPIDAMCQELASCLRRFSDLRAERIESETLYALRKTLPASLRKHRT